MILRGEGPHCAMRLKMGRYYRDAGSWGFTPKWVGGELTVDPDSDPRGLLLGATFVSVSESKWRKNNGLPSKK